MEYRGRARGRTMELAPRHASRPPSAPGSGVSPLPRFPYAASSWYLILSSRSPRLETKSAGQRPGASFDVSRRSAGRGRLRHGIDRHLLPVLVLELELDHAVRDRKERIVGGAADVLAGVEPCSALAHDDVPGQDFLAAELLDAEELGVAGAPVLAGAYALFMCHDCLTRP